ncbi:hypothetical protein GCM10022255_099340 [Dactylosporangium darangshiense]|uniref:Uncharacterized protein n=1 Tax=Dactylosporangium darangshiense TaxID=579108 RepID=A0ABP8DRG0_9ACTN
MSSPTNSFDGLRPSQDVTLYQNMFATGMYVNTTRNASGATRKAYGVTGPRRRVRRRGRVGLDVT